VSINFTLGNEVVFGLVSAVFLDEKRISGKYHHLMLHNREIIDVVYLNYKKAFDRVPHERLLKKLGTYGVIGSILK